MKTFVAKNAFALTGRGYVKNIYNQGKEYYRPARL